MNKKNNMSDVSKNPPSASESEKQVHLSQLDLPQDLKRLSIPQCRELCREIRSVLVHTVSKTGGHLASNLGVVELTMAIHRIFDSPDDKIVWDVGHQSYTHKILTGRFDKFDTLRKENGISGFPKPSESEHDSFISGHSSTSVSVACGIAQAMKIDGKPNYTVAVIGDGAMTGGLAYEGLNNSGKSGTRLIVILNQNDMSISKNVGGLASYLRNFHNKEGYINTKNAVNKTLTKTPVIGEPLKKAIVASKKALKGAVYNTSTLFEDLGFMYLGPVDGHDLESLEQILAIAKTYEGPVLVHVSTVKGKGYKPAEQNPAQYHGIARFDILTGNPEVSSSDSYSSVFGRELLRLAESDDRICAVTAAMKYGTGLQWFGAKFPERFFDVGIAEQHAVTFSAALASMGKIPVFAVYSSFLQRSYDQLIHDASISGVHMVIGIDRAGIVGEDGETHQGMFDVPMLTTIPNTVIFSPSCYKELKECISRAIYDEKGIVCVRYPRGSDNTSFENSDINKDFSLLSDNFSDTLVITYGRIYDDVCKAVNLLENENINCHLLKLNKIFPISADIVNIAVKYRKVIFFEESYGSGSISEHFALRLIENNFKGVYRRFSADGFIKSASVARCLESIGLDCKSVCKHIKEVVSGV